MRSLSPELLYLDFDGVLCDSLEECFRSSWLTLTETDIGPEAPPEPPFDAAYRGRFDACRPFIRSGEDYLVAHEWAARGSVPASQRAFDESLAAHGAERMAERKVRLYRVRDRLLEAHRSLWLSWNPLYPGIAAALAAQVDNESVWILSTKKAEFIVEILAHQGVLWPMERTLYTGTRGKLDIIEELAGRPSLLVDDQIDHLDFDHPTCQCVLALWGYVAPTQREVPSWTLAQALDRISGFPRALPPNG